MDIREEIINRIYWHQREHYYEPHFIVLNSYTKDKLEKQIHKEERMSEWAEFGNHMKFHGIPVLLKVSHEKEIYIDTILDWTRMRE